MIVEKRVYVDETFSARFQIDPTGQLFVHWSLRRPEALSKAMLDNYLAGRNRAITEALGMRPDLPLSAYRTAAWK